MQNNVLTVTLAIALFCGSVMADGNMGQGGYTGCDGDNPPPTCECNVSNPPAGCETNGGFANVQNSSVQSPETDYFLAAEIIGENFMASF
jgi:hypothetical protein